jgi:hypothetical protein
VTSQEWGRVAEDGTVYVKTAEGERPVGSYPSGTPEEALKFFTDRFAALDFEVGLLEQRLQSRVLTPHEATNSVNKLKTQISAANAVGNLAGLAERLDSLLPVIEEQRTERAQERAQKAAATREAKDYIVAEAERLAGGKDWRNGAVRLRELLDEWKALPRIDRGSDDELWRRFSTARTTYTRRRKAHFAVLAEERSIAQQAKEKLTKRAEGLADSTDWEATATAFRQLMREWKAAGSAPRDVDEALWQRFRAAQDNFFAARQAVNARIDTEYAANAEIKQAILVEAEALLPVQDLTASKAAFRELSERWDAAGRVPKEMVRELEGRMRKVEQAIRSKEDERWRRSDPEKSARADDMVSKLVAAINKVELDLQAARAAGNEKLVGELEANLESRQLFLEAAKRASSEFSG